MFDIHNRILRYLFPNGWAPLLGWSLFLFLNILPSTLAQVFGHFFSYIPPGKSFYYLTRSTACLEMSGGHGAGLQCGYRLSAGHIHNLMLSVLMLDSICCPAANLPLPYNRASNFPQVFTHTINLVHILDGLLQLQFPGEDHELCTSP